MQSAGQTLAKILKKNAGPARALRQAFDRTTLWRLCKGRVLPRAETAFKIEQLTYGELPASTWYV